MEGAIVALWMYISITFAVAEKSYPKTGPPIYKRNSALEENGKVTRTSILKIVEKIDCQEYSIMYHLIYCLLIMHCVSLAKVNREMPYVTSRVVAALND